ncbi:C40 family peptidase [Actinomadura napierensis]|uniref:NlpC/P60 family protein n=1 Tax=Actinomadura napierensis TaxID=267854 RepID=A0ABP5LK81_9ACTN
MIAVSGGLGIVLLVVVLIVIIIGGQADACGTSQGGGQQPGASDEANSIPGNYLAIYKKAGPAYGIPWNVLAGIGKVETGHGTSNLPGVHSGENYAGAGGPMQFLAPTWKSFGVDGDGDGKADRYNPADAIPGAANYLRHNHGNEGGEALRKAIFQYNHSWDYVNLVLSWAKKYADGNFSIGGDNNTGATCIPGGNVAAGPTGQRIVAYAMRWLKTPYQWGAGTWDGPTGYACSYGRCGKAFDCSGLTMYAVAQATGGKIKLDHFTGSQQNDSRGARVSFAQLQPGDLVFFTHPGETVSHHVGIYIGGGQMVNAPHTGDWVKVSSIASGTYRAEFSGGMRFSVPADGQQ